MLINMRYLILLILFVFTSVQAEIVVYRHVDANGNVSFSDIPYPGTKQIELKLQTGYNSVDTAPETSKAKPAQAAVTGYQLAINSPTDQQSMWSNDGKVAVSLKIDPPLRAKYGDKVLLELDGQPAGSPSVQGRYTLNNVFRGTHSLVASIVDAQGNELTRSSSVTFFIHRATVKQTQRARPPGPFPIKP